MATVRLQLHDQDAEQLAADTASLHAELVEIDTVKVDQATTGAAPPGTRGLELAEIGALLLSVKPTAEMLGAVVGTVRQWLARRGSNRTIRLELAGDVLELTGASSEDQGRLVDEWIRLHSDS